jgi:FkbM family methyltransferase
MRLGQIINSVLKKFELKLIRRPKNKVFGVELEDDIKHLLHKIPCPIIFDVGANEGQSIAKYSQWFDKYQITAFEPSPNSFKFIQAQFGNNPNIQLEQLAVGDSEGVQDFGVFGSGHVNDSFLKPMWDDPKLNYVPVNVTSLDAYLTKKKIHHIDLLKIDTQGYDLKVLHGSKSALKKHLVKHLTVEMNFHVMYENQGIYMDIFQFLNSYGYRFLGFYGNWFVNDRLLLADACFIATWPNKEDH